MNYPSTTVVKTEYYTWSFQTSLHRIKTFSCGRILIDYLGIRKGIPQWMRAYDKVDQYWLLTKYKPVTRRHYIKYTSDKRKSQFLIKEITNETYKRILDADD